MKKRRKMIDALTWIVWGIQIIGTAVVMRLLPEEIPMHFNSSGKVDRYGSKNELIFLVFLTGFIILMYKAITKSRVEKAEKSEDEKEKQSAEASKSAMAIAGLVTALTMVIVEVVIVAEGFKNSPDLNASASIDWLAMVMNFILGFMMIGLGNIMPKSRNNGLFGVRTSWSRYNDETWNRSNRIGGRIMVVTGLVSVIIAALIRDRYSTYIVCALLLIAAALCTVASYRVYNDVIAKEKKDNSD